ncbi:MAG: hypothetical protein C0485_05565 [Pirellula sp.]|nr:hypothetical protein [Pirellula sp.]
MSRPVTVNIPHQLGKTEARRRIDEGFGRMRSQITGGLGRMLTCQERWEGDRLHFEAGTLGQKVTGRLDVAEDAVRIEVDLPEILAGLAERIAGKLKNEGQKLLK